ncbi:Uncharacterised protein [Bordetella pertussis]|nr:Uncharacterised protein [Bordetella pertussis]
MAAREIAVDACHRPAIRRLPGRGRTVRSRLARLRAGGLAGAARLARQRDQRHAALAAGDGLGGVADQRQVRAAADFRAIDVAQPQVHVVDQRGRTGPGVAGAEIAVHVGQGEAGVGQRAQRAFGMQLGHGMRWRVAQGVFEGADDVGFAAYAQVGLPLFAAHPGMGGRVGSNLRGSAARCLFTCRQIGARLQSSRVWRGPAKGISMPSSPKKILPR